MVPQGKRDSGDMNSRAGCDSLLGDPNANHASIIRVNYIRVKCLCYRHLVYQGQVILASGPQKI